MDHWTWNLICAGAAYCSLNLLDAWRDRGHTSGQAPVTHGSRRSPVHARSVGTVRLQLEYAGVYGLVMLADWLQGPYVFSLYHDEFGLPVETVAQLFVTGFASAGLASLFVGSWADHYGRKRMCLVFCATYSLSCATKMRNYLPSLFIGRLLGGVSTAILFSSFESWLVSSARTRGMPQVQLDSYLSRLTQLNGLVACAAGMLADASVTQWETYKAPFIASAACLFLAAGVIATQWRENIKPVDDNFAFLQEDMPPPPPRQEYPRLNRPLVALLAVSTVVETSVYLFVFLWVPMLQNSTKTDLPLGTIFSALMLSMSCGGAIYKLCARKEQATPEAESQPLLLNHVHGNEAKTLGRDKRVLAGVLVIASAALMIGGRIARPTEAQVWAFLIFEVAVGIYYSAAASLRSILLPETHRAQLTALFRLPLNVLVSVALLSGLSARGGLAFGICGSALLCCICTLPALSSTIRERHTSLPVER